MITLGQFPAEKILPLIGETHIRLEAESGVWYPKTNTNRLMLFQKNQKCVSCNLVGTLFLLQSHKPNPPIVGHNCFIEECPWCAVRARPRTSDIGDYPHLNLYARGRSRLILMTQDHIIPKSRGGADELLNLQTMCSTCNNAKGALLPEEQKAGLKKRQIVWSKINHKVITNM